MTAKGPPQLGILTTQSNQRVDTALKTRYQPDTATSTRDQVLQQAKGARPPERLYRLISACAAVGVGQRGGEVRYGATPSPL